MLNIPHTTQGPSVAPHSAENKIAQACSVPCKALPSESLYISEVSRWMLITWCLDAGSCAKFYVKCQEYLESGLREFSTLTDVSICFLLLEIRNIFNSDISSHIQYLCILELKLEMLLN